MRLLLDSHALLWWLTDVAQLSSAARTAIDRAELVAVSAATFYELRLKERLGKLRGIPEELGDACNAMGFLQIPITPAHATRAAKLPMLHRDPWDRLLIAQAETDRFAVVSADRLFRDYGVHVVW